jgi:hypothetical protein
MSPRAGIIVGFPLAHPAVPGPMRLSIVVLAALVLIAVAL